MTATTETPPVTGDPGAHPGTEEVEAVPTDSQAAATETMPAVVDPPTRTGLAPRPALPTAVPGARQSAPERRGPLNPPPPGVRRRRPTVPKPAKPKRQPIQPTERAERNLVWIGLTASTIGLCLVLFVGYTFVFTGFEAERHQIALLNSIHSPTGAAALSGAVPANGQPAAVLDIPALHLKQVVVQGTTATDLLWAPGIMPGTARPGTRGNAVIAGRRSTGGRPFADLAQLRRGDLVEVDAGLGRFRYRVVRVATASLGSIDPVSATRRARLTLVTSNPAYTPTGRLYVVADLITKPASGRYPLRPPSPAERGLSGDPAAVLPSVLWGMTLAVALGAMVWAYLRWKDRRWTIYLLSTPIVLALAFVWYQNLIRLLPATM